MKKLAIAAAVSLLFGTAALAAPLKIGVAAEPYPPFTSPDASGAGEPVSRGTATVIDLSESADGQSLLTVSLAVPSNSATAISSAGAAGQLSLVVTAP